MARFGKIQRRGDGSSCEQHCLEGLPRWRAVLRGVIVSQGRSAPRLKLLVEDDPSVAEATQDLLHNMGFDTC